MKSNNSSPDIQRGKPYKFGDLPNRICPHCKGKGGFNGRLNCRACCGSGIILYHLPEGVSPIVSDEELREHSLAVTDAITAGQPPHTLQDTD